MSKSYTELSKLKTFEERFEYLRLNGSVGEDTFGFDRIFNQVFYRSKEWKSTRDFVIVRDGGCDLGVEGYDVCERIMVHHINPITMDDINNRSPKLFDPENLISTSHRTHNAIHYGDASLLVTTPVERSANDTCPWKRN